MCRGLLGDILDERKCPPQNRREKVRGDGGCKQEETEVRAPDTANEHGNEEKADAIAVNCAMPFARVLETMRRFSLTDESPSVCTWACGNGGSLVGIVSNQSICDCAARVLSS